MPAESRPFQRLRFPVTCGRSCCTNTSLQQQPRKKKREGKREMEKEKKEKNKPGEPAR